jgi:hypothetical protein
MSMHCYVDYRAGKENTSILWIKHIFSTYRGKLTHMKYIVALARKLKFLYYETE